MKYLIILLTLIASVSFAGETCSETQNVSSQEVAYEVDTTLPKHLKGATITVTLADGRSSTVPADKFMVVPRKQKTVLGQNQTITKKLSCSKSGKKNILLGEVRKDVTDIDASVNGKTATVESEKALVPGVNYYRRELFDSPIGAGVGIDSNGTLKGMIGLDF
jgi:hypothetical protein